MVWSAGDVKKVCCLTSSSKLMLCIFYASTLSVAITGRKTLVGEICYDFVFLEKKKKIAGRTDRKNSFRVVIACVLRIYLLIRFLLLFSLLTINISTQIATLYNDFRTCKARSGWFLNYFGTKNCKYLIFVYLEEWFRDKYLQLSMFNPCFSWRTTSLVVFVLVLFA